MIGMHWALSHRRVLDDASRSAMPSTTSDCWWCFQQPLHQIYQTLKHGYAEHLLLACVCWLSLFCVGTIGICKKNCPTTTCTRPGAKVLSGSLDGRGRVMFCVEATRAADAIRTSVSCRKEPNFYSPIT